MGPLTSATVEPVWVDIATLDEPLDRPNGTATLGESLGDLDGELDVIDDRETLRVVLARLTPRDRTILALRFFRGLTQTQIAKQVGLSQMHVSRALRQTLALIHEQITNPR